jgi:hypothetical protein
LVATGVVGLGVGLGLYVQGRADERGAARAEDLQAFDDHALRAIRLNQAAIATLAVASGLAVAGVIRYAVLGRRDRRRRTRMAAGSVLSVRF